jgi:PadR family transcriptional regulator PadR
MHHTRQPHIARGSDRASTAGIAWVEDRADPACQLASLCIALLGMSAEQLKGHLDPLVMAILESGPAHGYAIIEELRTRSSGVFDLPEGTIYPALHRLEHAGSITSRRVVVAGRHRRVYRLSTQGRAALRERRHAWGEFSSAINQVMGVQPA